MKFLNLSSLLLVALWATGTNGEGLRGVTTNTNTNEDRNLQAGDADVVGCVTVTGPSGTRTVAPCTPAAASSGTSGGMGVAASEDDNSKDDKPEDSEDNMVPVPTGPTPSTGGVVSNPNDGTPFEATSTSSTSPTIAGLAVGTPSLSSLYRLVVTAGLGETLASPGPFTVFAPVNSAFPSGLDFLQFQSTTPPATLQSVLTYHVVPGTIRSTDLVNGAQVTTVQGSNITVSLTGAGGGAMINDANVITADIEASNGIVHLIDSMLTPP